MTINDLFAGAIEMLVRIAWAFERTFILVVTSRLGELVLSDLAIVAVVGGLGLVVVFTALAWVFVEIEVFFSPGPPPGDDA